MNRIDAKDSGTVLGISLKCAEMFPAHTSVFCQSKIALIDVTGLLETVVCSYGSCTVVPGMVVDVITTRTSVTNMMFCRWSLFFSTVRLLRKSGIEAIAWRFLSLEK